MEIKNPLNFNGINNINNITNINNFINNSPKINTNYYSNIINNNNNITNIKLDKIKEKKNKEKIYCYEHDYNMNINSNSFKVNNNNINNKESKNENDIDCVKKLSKYFCIKYDEFFHEELNKKLSSNINPDHIRTINSYNSSNGKNQINIVNNNNYYNMSNNNGYYYVYGPQINKTSIKKKIDDGPPKVNMTPNNYFYNINQNYITNNNVNNTIKNNYYNKNEEQEHQKNNLPKNKRKILYDNNESNKNSFKYKTKNYSSDYSINKSRFINRKIINQNELKNIEPPNYILPLYKKRALSQEKPLNLIKKYYDNNFIMEEENEEETFIDEKKEKETKNTMNSINSDKNEKSEYIDNNIVDKIFSELDTNLKENMHLCNINKKINNEIIQKNNENDKIKIIKDECDKNINNKKSIINDKNKINIKLLLKEIKKNKNIIKILVNNNNNNNIRHINDNNYKSNSNINNINLKVQNNNNILIKENSYKEINNLIDKNDIKKHDNNNSNIKNDNNSNNLLLNKNEMASNKIQKNENNNTIKTKNENKNKIKYFSKKDIKKYKNSKNKNIKKDNNNKPVKDQKLIKLNRQNNFLEKNKNNNLMNNKSRSKEHKMDMTSINSHRPKLKIEIGSKDRPLDNKINNRNNKKNYFNIIKYSKPRESVFSLRDTRYLSRSNYSNFKTISKINNKINNSKMMINKSNINTNILNNEKNKAYYKLIKYDFEKILKKKIKRNNSLNNFMRSKNDIFRRKISNNNNFLKNNNLNKSSNNKSSIRKSYIINSNDDKLKKKSKYIDMYRNNNHKYLSNKIGMTPKNSINNLSDYNLINSINDSNVIRKQKNLINTNKTIYNTKKNILSNISKKGIKILKIKPINSPKSNNNCDIFKKCAINSKYYKNINSSPDKLNNKKIKINNHNNQRRIKCLPNTSKHKENKSRLSIFNSSIKNKPQRNFIRTSLTNSNCINNLENNIFHKYNSDMKNWIHKSQEVITSPISWGDSSLRLYDKLKYNTLNENYNGINKNITYYNKIYKTPKYCRNLNKNHFFKKKKDKLPKNIGEYYYKNNITTELMNKDNSINKSIKDNNHKVKKKYIYRKKYNLKV